MFENTKCECGHQNHVGTVLCEACGKPQQELPNDVLLEMRYDGVARRSQRQIVSWIDRVWRFFSSVKIAVYMIVITLITAIFGTIFPQENVLINMDPLSYYKENYGVVGEIYYWLGFSRTYETWWFRSLLIMIGTSLVVCSLDRVLPLYRALNKTNVRKHKQFIVRQRVVYTGRLFGEDSEQDASAQWIDRLRPALKKKGYRVRVEDSALLAEKNRFSRWGPYINHIGLIIFLLAALLRSIVPGWHMDDYVTVMEGEIKQLKGTPYYLKNEQFTVEFYGEDEMSEGFRAQGRTLPKLFETKAVLYECVSNCDNPSLEPELKEVHRHDIQVNHPLQYEGLLLYQIDFELTPQIRGVEAQLVNKETGELLGEFPLRTADPDASYTVGDYTIQLVNYYPDFTYENGQPGTKSSQPNAPAFVFLISGPGHEDGSVHLYFPKPDDKLTYQQDRINEAAGSLFDIRVDSMEQVDLALYSSFLNVRADRALPYIWVGAGISMIGLIMGFYWQHRRIWLRIDDGELTLGAHTNKDWFGMRRDVAYVLAAGGIEIDPKKLENEVHRS